MEFDNFVKMKNSKYFKLQYLVPLFLILWSISCGFRLLELVDVYSLILEEEFSFSLIFLKKTSILYEIIICLFLGIILFTKKLESIKYDAVWVISFSYILIFFYLLILETDTFDFNRFKEYRYFFILGFIFNVIYISFFKRYSIIRTVLLSLVSIILAFSLIKFKLFI